MSITTAMCTSFKKESWNDLHHLGDLAASPIGGDIIKLALIYLSASPLGTYGAASTNYSDITGNSEEAVSTSSPVGYSAGGVTLTNNGVTTSGVVAFADFVDFTLSAVTLNADGCMLYNSTNGNRAISLHDFGGTKSPSAGDFTVNFPTADSSNAILRLA